MAWEASMRTLRIAAVQLENRPGDPLETRAATERLVARAAEAGAELVVLPELSATGYVPNDSVWDLAEPLDGPSLRHARDVAARHRVHLGTGFAERDGEDLYNTYVLIDPDGAMLGSVRKHDPETACFRRGSGDVAIETALGRIGVAICADNHRVAGFERMRAARIDLLLMPHAWPMPPVAGGAVSAEDAAAARRHARSVPAAYASHLGVPVVFANAVGPFPPMPGALGWLMARHGFVLGGQTHAVESDGRTVGPLTDGEDLVVATVTLGAAIARIVPPPTWDGWLQPGSGLLRRVVLPLDSWWGSRRYRRRRRQRAASSAPPRSRPASDR
jgi:N-carbamoylputrescine amidase